MRAAKYARAREVAGQPPMVPTPPANQAKKAKPAEVAPAAPTAASPATDAVADELCGHKNMSGRTCTREKGHAAKSHRYS